MSPGIRVLIVDDHPLVLKGYEMTFQDYPEISIMGHCKNGLEFLNFINNGIIPDVVLLDIEMPVMNGLEAMKITKRERPDLKIIIVSYDSSENYIKQCIAAGANSYVPKSEDPEVLVETIQKVAKHGIYFSPVISKAISNQMRKKEKEEQKLTGMEMEVLLLVCDSCASKNIADKRSQLKRLTFTKPTCIKNRLQNKCRSGDLRNCE